MHTYCILHAFHSILSAFTLAVVMDAFSVVLLFVVVVLLLFCFVFFLLVFFLGGGGRIIIYVFIGRSPHFLCVLSRVNIELREQRQPRNVSCKKKRINTKVQMAYAQCFSMI